MYIMFLNKPPKMHCNHTVTSGEKSLPHSTGALPGNLPGKFPQSQSHLAKFDFGTGKLKVYFSENW